MEEKIKILFLITKANFGGAQRYVFDLATRLPKEKFETAVACGTKEGTMLIDKLTNQGIKTIPLESSEREINLKNDLKTLKEIVRIIGEEKPGIVHLNSSKIGLLGSLAILYLRFSAIVHDSKFTTHSIFTSHGWAFNEENRSAISKLIFYTAYYITILICDKTIAVSEKTKKDIDWMPFVGSKIEIIHNGIEKFKLLSKKDSSEILKKESKDQTIIFTIAELHKNKGLDVAIKGISLLPQEVKSKLLYYIAGGGEEFENLKMMVRDLGLENSVRFLGFIDNARNLLHGADIFLLPSRTENLPFALLEAGLAGLPIIATSVGGIAEIVRDMQNGVLVHPRNPKEIAESILYLMDHKEKEKEFALEIKKTVENFFSIEKAIAKTQIIYETVII